MPRQFWIKIINNFILNCRQIFVLIIKNEIILFENQGVKLEVNLKDETVWLNLEQMSELFSNVVKIYDTNIPFAIKAAETTSKGKSIIAYDKNSKVTEAYSLFAKEVLKDNERERRKNALSQDR